MSNLLVQQVATEHAVVPDELAGHHEPRSPTAVSHCDFVSDADKDDELHYLYIDLVPTGSHNRTLTTNESSRPTYNDSTRAFSG